MRFVKAIEPISVTLLVCFSAMVGFSASCIVKSTTSQVAQRPDSKPRETPVPLQPNEGNKGKRCATKVYSNVGKDEDYNPFCYEVERQLVKAAHEGNLHEMRTALADGANANGSVYDFYYPVLYTAADAGQADAVRLLLDNGASVNQGDFINGTPLIVAAGNGHTEVVKILLERGADVCLKADGGTAKEFAEKHGYEEIVKLLKAAETTKCKETKPTKN